MSTPAPTQRSRCCGVGTPRSVSREDSLSSLGATIAEFWFCIQSRRPQRAGARISKSVAGRFHLQAPSSFRYLQAEDVGTRNTTMSTPAPTQRSRRCGVGTPRSVGRADCDLWTDSRLLNYVDPFMPKATAPRSADFQIRSRSISFAGALFFSTPSSRRRGREKHCHLNSSLTTAFAMLRS